MKQFPLERSLVAEVLKKNNLESVGKASIREVKKVVDDIESAVGVQFVRMEMGIPGLPAAQVGVEAEIQALRNGVASQYPDIYGTKELKEETKKFVKNFINIDVNTDCCVPTVGSMQGGFAAFLTIARYHDNKKKILFIDPGFPVQKQQARILGIPSERFDVYEYRGEKLRAKLESYCSKGDIGCLLYSSPNNPAWFCFTEEELQIIADVANKYDVVVIEDLAYFGMDFRKDYGTPGVAPYQPSAAHHAKKYILLISGSKAFSYAGQRIAVMIISPELYKSSSEGLKKYYGMDSFGRALIFGSLYALTSGTAHSPQYALTAIFKACNEGKYDFVNDVRDYGIKAKQMKKAFTDNGFKIVYDKDLDEPIADGFYFTFGYPGYTGAELLSELAYYGVSAISLSITGSERIEGIRACVSKVPHEMIPALEERLKLFHADHPIK